MAYPMAGGSERIPRLFTWAVFAAEPSRVFAAALRAAGGLTATFMKEPERGRLSHGTERSSEGRRISALSSASPRSDFSLHPSSASCQTLEDLPECWSTYQKWLQEWPLLSERLLYLFYLRWAYMLSVQIATLKNELTTFWLYFGTIGF